MTGYVDTETMVVSGPYVLGNRVLRADDTTYDRPAVLIEKTDGTQVWLPVKKLLKDAGCHGYGNVYEAEWQSGVGGGPRELPVPEQN